MATDEDVKVALIKMRSDFAKRRNEQRRKVLAHILWVSATVFAVIVIAGRAEYDAVFSVAVVLNALCVLFCSISLYEDLDVADRYQAALAEWIKSTDLPREDRRKNVDILIQPTVEGVDVSLKDKRLKLFVVCEKASYVCFVLTVICLTVFCADKII